MSFAKKRVNPQPSLLQFFETKLQRTYDAYLTYCWDKHMLASNPEVFRAYSKLGKGEAAL